MVVVVVVEVVDGGAAMVVVVVEVVDGGAATVVVVVVVVVVISTIVVVVELAVEGSPTGGAFTVGSWPQAATTTASAMKVERCFIVSTQYRQHWQNL